MEIRRILFPTDFSPCARQAFAPATSLARRYGAELHLLHTLVLHGQEPHEPMFYMPAPEEAYEGAAAVARQELAALAETATAEGARLVQVVRRDFSAAAGILEYALEAEVDLIVLGTHGRRGPARLLLGSVAEEVMRTAACPVLAMRPPAGGTNRPVTLLRRILVPFDFTPAARAALRAAADVARRYGSRLSLLHVVEEPIWPEVYGVEAASELLAERELARERGELRLRDVARALPADVPYDVEVCVGSPATEILKMVDRPAIDLVVMGTRGQTGVRRLVMGSTAEEVVRLSVAPVMVVKDLATEAPESPPAEEVQAREEAAAG